MITGRTWSAKIGSSLSATRSPNMKSMPAFAYSTSTWTCPANHSSALADRPLQDEQRERYLHGEAGRDGAPADPRAVRRHRHGKREQEREAEQSPDWADGVPRGRRP
jgi:hypothetical protein